MIEAIRSAAAGPVEEGDTTGNGRTVRAIPIEQLKALLTKYGR